MNFAPVILFIFLQTDDLEGKIISKVDGAGFERHSFYVMRNLLKTRKGCAYSAEVANDDVKTLWKTGYFSKIGKSVSIDNSDASKVVVTFEVVEKQQIDSFEFSGNRNIAERVLAGEVLKTSLPAALDDFDLSRMRDDISSYYRDKGYHFCEVSYGVADEKGKRKLIWKINEGPLVRVRDIIINSSADLDISGIKSKMATKETTFLSSKPFVLDWLESDVDRIKRYLRESLGYLGAPDEGTVFVEDVSFSDDKTWADVTIHVEPGPIYNLDSIEFSGNTNVTTATLFKFSLLKKGEVFTEEKLFKTEQKFRDLYEEKGYLNVDIDAEWIVAERAPSVKVYVRIKEGDIVDVGEIMIKGNTKTRESRIRLDLRHDVVSGEPINKKGLQRAVRRLIDRGWFSRGMQSGQFSIPVEYKLLESGLPNTRDVEITVKEGSTARLNVAFGYSDSFGATALINFLQQNFDISGIPDLLMGRSANLTGAGQTLSIRAVPQAKRQQYDLRFVEPYLFSLDLGYSLSVFSTRTLREAWVESRTGTSTGIVKRWEDLSAGLNFTYFGQQFSSISTSAPQIIKDLEGTKQFVSFTPSITYDNRNSFILPTEGYRFEASYEVFQRLFGGDFEMGKLIIENEMHYPVFEQDKDVYHAVSFVTKLGWLEEFGDTKITPVSERFFGGGLAGPRGFRFRGVSPRQNGDPVGGNAKIIQTVEYGIPVVPNNFYLAWFFDVGNVETDFNKIFQGEFRSSTGLELRFIIGALGNVPAKLGFGFIVNRRDDDKSRFILFDLGPFFR